MWKDIIKSDEVETLFNQRQNEAYNSRNERAIQFYAKVEKTLEMYLKNKEPELKNDLMELLQEPFSPELERKISL